jgi:hypothetical protein
MIVCDEVVVDSQRQGKLTIVGLTTVIKWPQGATTSSSLERLVVLLVLTDGRGSGTGRVECVNEMTGHVLFRSKDHTVSFAGKDPSRCHGFVFKIADCRFPGPGAYTIHFRFNEEVIARQTLIVRENHG